MHTWILYFYHFHPSYSHGNYFMSPDSLFFNYYFCIYTRHTHVHRSWKQYARLTRGISQCRSYRKKSKCLQKHKQRTKNTNRKKNTAINTQFSLIILNVNVFNSLLRGSLSEKSWRKFEVKVVNNEYIFSVSMTSYSERPKMYLGVC